MTLARLQELANHRLTVSQLLAIKEEIKAECVRAVEQTSAYQLRCVNDPPSRTIYLVETQEAIQAIKEV